ncbi:MULTISPECIES: hypothetical protein [unclassified Coleofasciculus]|uniref:hypothetical protein n=1 Tax=unclassified Coleofasciculus TaxID=2692782 RepID=UPI001881A3F7|nr:MULTISPECIES: hypothetical protein [unclassified Coleofasciculus]MBE9129468.1 hypothetical protein [Coleofasciculus sp. LEGE 07081]MBE9152097.1 hypothetical protein [Coleofasciculus sp. LEGE 07092]
MYNNEIARHLAKVTTEAIAFGTSVTNRSMIPTWSIKGKNAAIAIPPTGFLSN